MKKLSKVLALGMAAVAVMGLFACGGDSGSGNKGDGTSLTLMQTGGREVLFEFLNAGYGKDPYIAVANGFMERHPDVQIVLVPNREIGSTTGNVLSSGVGISDVYSYTHGHTLRKWVTDGYVEDLTDLCNEQTLDGRTMLESMTGNAAQAITANGKIYGVPEYTSVVGMVYNKDLFEKYNWEIPTTTKELEDLCKQILKDTDNKVSPITWCQSADGYFYFATENFISQYEGIAKLDKFYQYESPEIYALEDNEVGSISTAKGLALENLVKFWTPIKDGGYAYDKASGISNTDAQAQIIRGEAAMMLNGSWFENEMSLYLRDENIGMFPVPQLSDKNGTPLRSDDFTTQDDKRVLSATYECFYFIPKGAPNKEDAKDFLLYLSSEEACSLYTQYSNAVRPFIYDTSADSELYGKVSEFGKSIMLMAHENYMYSPISASDFDIKGCAGLWPRGGRVESEIMHKNAASKDPQYWLKKDYDYAKDMWDDWLKMVNGK